MPTVIDSFSVNYDYHRLPVKKGFGKSGEQLEDFLHYFRQQYDAQDVAFADPGLGWQQIQYNGAVCVGVFAVYTMTPDGRTGGRVGIISTNVHHMEHAALKWLDAQRQRNPDGSGKWPTIAMSEPFENIEVYPVQIPEEGML